MRDYTEIYVRRMKEGNRDHFSEQREITRREAAIADTLWGRAL
jgi:hypothetical protein